jgi:putative cardiolipin synthase
MRSWSADVVEKADPNAKDLTFRSSRRSRPCFEGAQSEILLISPYFIPGEQGIAFLSAIAGARRADQGVDQLAGLERRARRALGLRAGCASRCSRAACRSTSSSRRPRTSRRSGSGTKTSPRAARCSGSTASGLALHAKAVVVDRRHVLIGSMNMDPRSKVLNTEVGALVDSPALAEDVAAFFADDELAGARVPRHARARARGLERPGACAGPRARVRTRRPGRTSPTRARASAFALRSRRILPIDGLL